MMLIFTLPLPKRNTVYKLTALALAVILIAVGRSARLPARAVNATETALCLGVLERFGWQAAATPVDSEVFELKAPIDEGYLALQTQAGFDLMPYVGQMVTRYTFTLLNYPTGEAGVVANVLVCRGEVIGGDVRTASLDGFMHSLVRPAG